jgi:hypothetical protein
MFVTGVNQNGTVVCAADANAGGDITGVTAGAGLTGGGATGGVTLTVDTAAIQARVTGTCAAGMYVTGVNQNGTVVCATDAVGTGDITGVTAGTGLSGGGTSGAPTLSVNPAAVQTRVTGTCAAGMYVTGVNQNGTVVCGTDANSGGDITGVTAGTGLTGTATSGNATIGIANNGVNTAQIAAGAVTMSKTSGPMGMATVTGSAANSSAIFTNAAAVAMNDAGSCFVTAWSTGQLTSWQLRPAMQDASGTTTTVSTATRSYATSGGAGAAEANATGVFSVAAGGSYRFGCFYQGFLSNMTLNASCQTSWICN